jgi:glycosyltransferase involved in cell wall biosynthesis
MTSNHKIAYISRLIYPSPAANALQTIHMATALAQQTGDTSLFVHDLAASEPEIRQQYGLVESPLRIVPLNTSRWPRRLYENTMARFLSYNSLVAGRLGLHREWRQARAQRKVLYVRSRLEALYWGLMRPYLGWLRDWIFIYEAHDLEGDSEEDDQAPSLSRLARTKRALGNYDLVICITGPLAGDIEAFTEGAVKPVVLSLATGLPRLQTCPQPGLDNHLGKITLGYVGTVDQMRGVDDVFKALRFLPDQIRLRIVGRIPDSNGSEGMPAWLSDLLRDPAIANRVEFHSPVPYSQVAAEIDACDLVLQPAGLNAHASRYAAPLKLFDYMARGKPILAAGVPCHLELLQDGMNARIYKPGDPQDLASEIMTLVNQPLQAEAIAKAAWEQSANYTYQARAKRILQLVDEVQGQRNKEVNDFGLPKS